MSKSQDIAERQDKEPRRPRTAERVYVLTDNERVLIREGIEELDRGEVATEAEVSAVFAKYDAVTP